LVAISFRIIDLEISSRTGFPELAVLQARSSWRRWVRTRRLKSLELAELVSETTWDALRIFLRSLTCLSRDLFGKSAELLRIFGCEDDD
jgi:hypothetical protein